jgi:hypothetical protein
MAVLRAPVGLGKAGKAQWSSIAGSYRLRPDEFTVLEDVCRTTDMLAALTAAWVEDGSPMTTSGSMGQLVIHPLIPSIGAHRKARAAFLKQLGLPDADEGAVPVPNQHRDAANTKWSERGA